MKHFLFFIFLLNLSSFSFLDDGLSHQCRPATKRKMECSSKMLLCPPGYMDGCLSGESEQHECLLKHEGPACIVPLELSCPSNFTDGCMTGQTDTHECVPEKGPSCEAKIKYACPMGFEDACE